MSRRNLTYVCQNCGAASARWQGKCEGCGEWKSMVEEGDGLGGVAGRPAGSVTVTVRNAASIAWSFGFAVM